MPITITPTEPAGVLTPGGHIAFQSDFIGPFPNPPLWTATISPVGDEGTTIWSMSSVLNSHVLELWLFRSDANNQLVTGNSVSAGSTVTLHVNLQDSVTGAEIDSGSSDLHWDPTLGLGIQLHDKQAGSQSGLTPIQAQQLDEAHQSTFPSIALDTLTLLALTTSGPSPGPINANLPNPCFGVIVRLANVPATIVAGTPDGDYWLPTLAVVRIFRGADLWKRVPIHTSSKLVELLDESIVAGLTAITATQWLLNLSLQVTFLEGVTGEVFLMLLP